MDICYSQEKTLNDSFFISSDFQSSKKPCSSVVTDYGSDTLLNDEHLWKQDRPIFLKKRWNYYCL